MAAIALGDNGVAEHSCPSGPMIYHVKVVLQWLTGNYPLPYRPWCPRDLLGFGSWSSKQ